MLKPIQIGWIDYSNEHREKVMSVLHLLTEPGAIDELGIGSIRDGFANIFFPGTSTIQTRAKYFLLVPYILTDLEKKTYKTPKLFLQKLWSEEINLIDVLNKDGAKGIIGSLSKEKLKRKPSSIYWNGIRTFEIFRGNIPLTIYAQLIYNKKSERKHEDGDDEDALQENGSLWSGVPKKNNWRENLKIELTYDEAQYLRNKIISAKESKDSLFAFILKNNYKVNEIERFEELGALPNLPQCIQEDFQMAEAFSQFIYGANIRYNILVSNHENQEAQEAWEAWYMSEFVCRQWDTYDIKPVVKRLRLAPGLVKFLKDWQEAVGSGDLEKIDEVIIKREKNLKRGRAKIGNERAYVYEKGNWLGGGKLQYRFSNAKVLIQDIYQGLEEANDKASRR